jgi:hypothetical protein
VPSWENGTRSAPATSSRRAVYAILIAITSAIMLARVVRLDSPDPKSPTPFLSANDRSRWATIRALGDDGTYVIDHIIFDARGNRIRGWHTIDLVKHRGSDGQEHYYSSKPTLLTTLLAGEYWLVKQITGATLAEQPHYVSRIMLVLTNIVPLAGALACLAWLIDRYATTDFARIFAVAAACFGTFMTTFAVTLNNHVTAAISLALGLAAILPILEDQTRAWWRFVAAGFAFGFLAANELPALSMLVVVGLLLLWKSPSRTFLAFLPALLLIAAGAFLTNYIAHGDWRTPYAHRSPGDNWYDYPGSYWLTKNLRGIDRGEALPLRYAFHVLIGHHGIFSLTPIWLLSATGCWLWLVPASGRRKALGDSEQPTRLNSRQILAITTILITLVVVAFYLTRPLIDRNYGGISCCLRWLIWLTPLWLLTLLPAADWFATCRFGRAIAMALLLVSVFSACYAADNPWSHPWIFDYWTSLGWIDYR